MPATPCQSRTMPHSALPPPGAAHPTPLLQEQPGLSIRTLLAILAALVILPLGFDYFYETWEEEAESYGRANESALQLAKVASVDVARFLRQSDALMDNLARRPLVQMLDPQHCDPLMQELPALLQRYEVPSTMDMNGRFICHSVPLARQPAEPGAEIHNRLQRMRAHPGFMLGDLKRGILTGNWIVPLSRPILDARGKLKGMLNLTVDLQRFSTLATAPQTSTQHALVLVDGRGQVLTGSGGMERFVGRDHAGIALGNWLAQHREGVARSRGLDGVERLFAFTPVAGSDWMVAAGIPAADIDRQVSDNRLLHSALGLLLLGAAAALLSYLYRRIERPISRLLATTRAVAEGDTDVRAEASRVPEFAEVGRGFNLMLDALQRQRRAIEESRGQLESVLAAVEEVIYSWSPRDGTVHFVSRAVERIYGVSVQDIHARPGRWIEAVHDEDKPRVTAAMQALKAGGSYDLEYRTVLPDGTENWVHDRARLILAADGSIERVDGLAIDITARRRAEQQVRESEARLSGFISTALDGIVMIDDTHRISLFNPSAERIFGWTAGELLGKPLTELIPVAGRKDHDRLVDHFGATGQPAHRQVGPGRVLGLRKNGENFPLDASISHMQLAGRSYYTAILRDRTEQEKNEQSIRALNEQLEKRVAERTADLERAMRQLESFSYSISHDLRAPLRAINGFSHILQETETARLSAEGKGLLDRIMKNAGRMGELIDDVLAYSRVTRAELRLTDVSMTGLAKDVATELREAHPAAHVELGPLPPCRGDAAMLRQVWANLIDNALKFSSGRETPRVVIGFARAEASGQDEYFVRDNGAGFDMQYAGQLFGVFQRMHGAQSFPGTGVGLSIVKQIIERHHGHIRAEATPGEGATFYFTIGNADASAG